MIVGDEQRRIMEFIATVNRGGHRPTGREINEWRKRPEAKPGRQGKLIKAAVPETPSRRVPKKVSSVPYRFTEAFGPRATWIGNAGTRGVFAEMGREIEALNKRLYGVHNPAFMSASRAIQAALAVYGPAEYETIPGKPGSPAVYGPDKPPEKFLAHLRRLGWIERDAKGGYGVTLLGSALLRSDAADASEDDSSVMVLAADDELAYGRVMGAIADCGDAFVMDAYLGTEELFNILKFTTATRFLVGDKLSKSRVTELKLLIELDPVANDAPIRQLRQAAFHDRWLIGNRQVYGLGASLNGVGRKSPTTLVEMPDAAARFIRATANDLWDDATPIAETRRDGSTANEKDEQSVPRAIHEENGAFQHEGCTMKHQSRRTARNCPKGA